MLQAVTRKLSIAASLYSDQSFPWRFPIVPVLHLVEH